MDPGRSPSDVCFESSSRINARRLAGLRAGRNLFYSVLWACRQEEKTYPAENSSPLTDKDHGSSKPFQAGPSSIRLDGLNIDRASLARFGKRAVR